MTASAYFERWVRFWDQREPPTSLCATRALVGLALFGDLAQALCIGAHTAAFAPPPAGIGYGALGSNAPWAARVFGGSTETAHLLFYAALLSAPLFAAGLLFRVSGLVLATALTELAQFAPDGDRAIDKLLRLVVIVLLLSAAGNRWSLDALIRRRLGRPAPSEAPAWPRYMLFAQLAWVYFSAAHNRSGRAWWPWGGFGAVSQILGDPHVSRFAPGFAAKLTPLPQIATALTMLFEMSAPVMILVTFLDRHPEHGGRVGAFVRRFHVRWLWLTLGVCLHLGIALSMRLGVFPFGILALYPVLLHPEELERAVHWLRARLSPRAALAEPNREG